MSGAGAFSDSKFNMDYRVGGDVHTIVGKQVVNDTIKDVVEVYRKFGFNEEPSGLKYNSTMEEIKRKCIEHGIQLVDTPTMHLGTDGSRKLYTQLIDYLIEKKVEFLPERDVESLIIENEETCPKFIGPMVILGFEPREKSAWLQSPCSKSLCYFTDRKSVV